MIESPLLPIRPSFKNSLLASQITFDDVIERLGINKFNLRVFLFIALFFMADGSEMVVLSLLLTKLTEVWQLNSFEKGSLGSSIFIGFAMGSLCSGYISDRRGRRPAYLIGATLVMIFASLSSLAQGFFSFILLRIICGFGIGLAIPALFALATELTPVDYRSAVLNNVWSIFPIGASFVIIMTKFFINTENGWRYVLLFASLPCCILLLFSYKVPESPRFHMSNGNYEKGFQNLDSIIVYSGLQEKVIITEKEKEDLINEAEQCQINKQKADYRILFSPEYKKLTILICSIYFLVSLNYYGATYILPQIFEEEHEKNSENVGDIYISLLLGCFFEVPACLLSGYLANHRHLLRIKTMMLGFLMNVVASIIILSYPHGISFTAALFKFSVVIPFNVIYVYACEAYPTKIRSMGVGLGNSCTRIAAILTPFISQFLFDIDEKLPFIVYGIGGGIGVAVCIMLPYETRHLGLK